MGKGYIRLVAGLEPGRNPASRVPPSLLLQVPGQLKFLPWQYDEASPFLPGCFLSWRYDEVSPFSSWVTFCHGVSFSNRKQNRMCIFWNFPPCWLYSILFLLALFVCFFSWQKPGLGPARKWVLSTFFPDLYPWILAFWLQLCLLCDHHETQVTPAARSPSQRLWSCVLSIQSGNGCLLRQMFRWPR